jgi:DNA-binding CsgD family transcriptional regulator
MTHVLFFFYLLAFSFGFSGLVVAGLAYLKTREKTYIRYVLFMSFFTLSLLMLLLFGYFKANQGSNSERSFHLLLAAMYYLRFFILSGVLLSSIYFVHSLLGLAMPKPLKAAYWTIGLIPSAAILASLAFKPYPTQPTFLYFTLIFLIPLAMLYMEALILRRLRRAPSILHQTIAKGFLVLALAFQPLLCLQYSGEILRFLRSSLFLEFGLYAAWNGMMIVVLWKYVFRKLVVAPTELSESFAAHYGITEAEGRVIGYVLRNYGNKQIAYDLGIAEQTVKTHLYNAYRKCGVNNRLGLVTLIMERHSPGERAD